MQVYFKMKKILVASVLKKKVSFSASLHNEIKKRCFLGRVEHGLALCHSYKWSPIQDWKKCYMRTSRSN